MKSPAGPNGWKALPLKAMVDLENGYPFDSEDFLPYGSTPLVRIRDLTSETFETYIDSHVPPRVLLQDGDVVVGMDGDFNVVNWSRGPAALNQRLCRLRGLDGFDLRFIAYALPDHLKLINETQYATTVKHLSSNEVLGVRLSVPPLEEQRRIADFLDDQTTRIDQAIQLRQQQEQLSQEAVTSWAVDRLSRGSRVTLRRLLSEAVVGIVVRPSDWYTDEPSSVPALRGLDVEEFAIQSDGQIRISVEGHRRHPRSRLQRRDVVVVRTGDAGAACMVPDWAEDWNAIDLIILRPNERCSPRFLELVVNAARWSDHIGAASSGSIQQHFGVGAALDLEVSELTLAEQERVEREFRGLRTQHQRLMGRVADSVKLLKERKRSLITAAVTGEFDVTTASQTRTHSLTRTGK